ncbi:MAG TPA: TetR family transcriptional regulator [Clostridiaceae bacterium]|jgi:AcrR family transcriptional regulator|nr:TetR family transcriptional regulator [Clostridiaceae bacterium]
MKYDITKKTTKGAERTLEAFSGTMFELLSMKSFEKITVNELCQRSNYPRATFYNYFDDKYDLLNYCWYSIGRHIHLEQYAELDPEESLYIFFDRAYDFASTYLLNIQRILKFNSMDSFLINHFRGYLGTQMREIFQQSSCKNHYKIPYEIIADHYCNTLLLILEWSFLKGKGCSKDQAHEYLKYLLDALQKY